MCTRAKEMVWIHRLLKSVDIVPEVSKPTLSSWTTKMGLHWRRRHQETVEHIDIRYHFTRHLLQQGAIHLEYCPTDKMVADIMTKALGRVKFQLFAIGCGLWENAIASDPWPKAVCSTCWSGHWTACIGIPSCKLQ